MEVVSNTKGTNLLATLSTILWVEFGWDNVSLTILQSSPHRVSDPAALHLIRREPS